MAEAQACYWPVGVAAGYKACSKAGGPCCAYFSEAHHDECYSNGLCQSLLYGRIYRGACTDKNWGRGCPNVCTEVRNDQSLLRYCKGLDAWCCDHLYTTGDCCSKGVGFQWNNATLVNYALAPQKVDHVFELSDAYTTVSATTTGTTLPVTTFDTQQSASATFATVSTNTCPGTPAPTEACAPPTTGIGLAAGLGVPLIATLAILLWMIAKQRYHRPDVMDTSIQERRPVATEVTQVRPGPDILQYEYTGGHHKWEKPQLHGDEIRRIAELN